MPKCFVIQPFDGGRFDRLYDQVFMPAILGADLEPYRVDRDANASILIEAIETGIRDASVCLAEISTPNPNVWYELGYAFAATKPVVMVSNREQEHFPFDVRHRKVLRYNSESPSDFSDLQSVITSHLKAQVVRDEVLQQLANSTRSISIGGLSSNEVTFLAVVAGRAGIANEAESVYMLRREVERAGLNDQAISLSARKLLNKGIVKLTSEEDDNGTYYRALQLTDKGWQWIEANEGLFMSYKRNEVSSNSEITDDDIPF